MREGEKKSGINDLRYAISVSLRFVIIARCAREGVDKKITEIFFIRVTRAREGVPKFAMEVSTTLKISMIIIFVLFSPSLI